MVICWDRQAQETWAARESIEEARWLDVELIGKG